MINIKTFWYVQFTEPVCREKYFQMTKEEANYNKTKNTNKKYKRTQTKMLSLN